MPCRPGWNGWNQCNAPRDQCRVSAERGFSNRKPANFTTTCWILLNASPTAKQSLRKLHQSLLIRALLPEKLHFSGRNKTFSGNKCILETLINHWRASLLPESRPSNKYVASCEALRCQLNCTPWHDKAFKMPRVFTSQTRTNDSGKLARIDCRAWKQSRSR